MSKKSVSIAYSPDTDDAFMVLALKDGRVSSPDFEFTFVSDDIQKLNEAAREGIFDVTAISIGAYPSLSEAYYLMPIGASIGDQFGPALIVTQDSPLCNPRDLVGRRVAVPGLQTSAYLAARQLIGAFTPVPMLFSDIGAAVMNGDVDAGILIHELQLNCEERGFKKLGDLGLLWDKNHHLPLPLGANAIKRSLGIDTITKITALMRESIEVGLRDREATLKAALALSKADLDESKGDRYIAMYVNRRSLALDPDVQQAINVLLGSGHEAGLCPAFNSVTAYYE